MQVVCQRNSLNRRNRTVPEIAELSEILTVQKNAKGAGCQAFRRRNAIGREVGSFACWMRESRYEVLGRCLLRRAYFEPALVDAETLDL